ncbi:Rha family transcriptional regulator [Propionivibrio sp.]|uniref:Rha family transcriptional regulator n=1 Tax=Propionivibrio sp. TaxID=2212460 RepID=UPI003BF368CD
MQISKFTPAQLVTSLVTEHQGKPVTTSLIVAEQLSRRHGDVMGAIDSLAKDGTIDVRGFSHISYTDTMNREQRAYQLDKRTALIAMPFIGGKKSREGQAKLVDAFLVMEELLKKRYDWQPVRDAGKGMRRDLTDAIADFIGYAKAQGASKGADHYYANFTKLEYKLLFAVATGMPKGFRNLLDVESLDTLGMVEKALSIHIRRAMEDDQPYKAIYVAAKGIAQTLVDIMGGRRILPDLDRVSGKQPGMGMPAQIPCAHA